MRKVLGRNKQVNCSYEDYYKFLGYLASHPNDAIIVFEHNSKQGAWGNEGRIQFRTDFVRSFFQPLGIKVTAGLGKTYDSRLNCNALFEELISLGFEPRGVHDISKIRRNIPTAYLKDFDVGLSL